MIHLESHHPGLVEVLTKRLQSERNDAIDMILTDFDGVIYHLSSAGSHSNLLISMRSRCFSDLKRYNTEPYLRQIYQSYFLPSPEPGYDASLLIDLEQLATLPNVLEIIQELSFFKRNAFAAPFYECFEQQEKGVAGELMIIRYREKETIYLRAQADRVTVVYSIAFKDETDSIFGKIFLQEFVDARNTGGLTNAPQVFYTTRQPPADIQEDHKSISVENNNSFVTFVLFPRHYATGTKRDEAINMLQGFRDYLHYHIKCSKAYLHTRMRSKVSDLLKVLNRARPELPVDRKTITGRSFKPR